MSERKADNKRKYKNKKKRTGILVGSLATNSLEMVRRGNVNQEVTQPSHS